MDKTLMQKYFDRHGAREVILKSWTHPSPIIAYIYSSVEKNATASGLLDPAGCSETTALKTEGASNSITAI